MAKIHLVIFDFDGTLVDTAPDLVRATNRFLGSKGLKTLPESRIRAEIGMGLKRLLVAVYPKTAAGDSDHAATLYEEFTKIYEEEYLHSPKLFDGAVEFLEAWSGKIAIVSNKRERFIMPILKKVGLGDAGWSRVIGGDTVGQMKPHPLPFLKAMEAAGARPEETLIVGDGIPDVIGALNVGSRCIVVDFGYTPADELMNLGGWARIENLSEIGALASRIT